jgi:hypothetical protein
MDESKDVNDAKAASDEVWQRLMPFIEIGCQEAFHKSFKEFAAMVESTGKKLTVEELMSMAALGIKASERKES